MLSKRKLIQLVKEQATCDGWDDPRMPTISGLRRRGYTPESIRDFCSRIGIARSADSVVHYSLLEFCCREHLNAVAPRCMAVLNPLKVVITDYPEDQVEEFDQPLHPEDASFGSRKVPFCREIYIDRDDFREDPPKKYFRLAPGAEVRLRYAYYITCQEVVKDADGNIVELHCTHDPSSRGGSSPDGRKVKGTLHWVSARHAVPTEVRLYEQMFTTESDSDIEEGKTFLDVLQPRFRKDRHGHGGTLSRHDARRQPRAVRARGLLLRRPRRHSRTPRVQPHRDAQGLLGEDRKETVIDGPSPAFSGSALGGPERPEKGPVAPARDRRTHPARARHTAYPRANARQRAGAPRP